MTNSATATAEAVSTRTTLLLLLLLIQLLLLLHTDVSKVRPEVDEDVNNKHDIHYEVHYIERRAGVTTTLHGYVFLREEMKREERIYKQS